MNLIRPNFFFLTRTRSFLVIVARRHTSSLPLSLWQRAMSLLLGSLDIINAFHVQRDDEDYNGFTQRIDGGSREVDAAIDALHLAGYDVIKNSRGNHRRKYKLTRIDPANALTADLVSDDDDLVVMCPTASSGKENNKRSKVTKTAAKKTARMYRGNKLALNFEAFKDSDDPLIREMCK